MISFLNPIRTLPTPLGPYKVGTKEWEIPASEIPSTAPVPDPRITTIKFRLFYPTEATAPPTNADTWLPSPQKPWNQAYSRFLGASPRVSSLISLLPTPNYFLTLPCAPDAPLLPQSEKFPVLIFSHGLGGNFNTYSAVLTSLASHGIIVAAPEHRDTSAPVAFIRDSSGNFTTCIPYQRHKHTPTEDVLAKRNAQLRIRCWELDHLFTVLSSLNAGKIFSNYASVNSAPSAAEPYLEDALDLQPGRVTWCGHSFGACTTVQFVKSVYHRESLPTLPENLARKASYAPLYVPPANSDLLAQVTSSSPMALLDLWPMPLKSQATNWLWERPLPCFDRDDDAPSSVLSVMSAEFYRWSALLNPTKAALSHRPVETLAELERRGKQQAADGTKSQASNTEDIMMATPPGKASPQPAVPDGPTTNDLTEVPLPGPALCEPDSSSNSDTDASENSNSDLESVSDASSLSSSDTSPASSLDQLSRAQSAAPPQLYLVPSSAHLSQSDFGVLYPNLTRYLMNARDPEQTIRLNVRAIVSMMRAQGLPVASTPATNVAGRAKRRRTMWGRKVEEQNEAYADMILDGAEERFVRVQLQ